MHSCRRQSHSQTLQRGRRRWRRRRRRRDGVGRGVGRLPCSSCRVRCACRARTAHHTAGNRRRGGRGGSGAARARRARRRGGAATAGAVAVLRLCQRRALCRSTERASGKVGAGVAARDARLANIRWSAGTLTSAQQLLVTTIVNTSKKEHGGEALFGQNSLCHRGQPARL